MTSYTWTIWCLIFGLSCLSVGGLVLWAYGARWTPTNVASGTVEVEATRHFHTRLARWFFVYGAGLLVAGLALLLWASARFF